MSTIYDIAQETGFSPSTVARALSGKGYCSEKAREIIRQAAQRLDYAPVQAAKALKNKLTKKVMFCIPDMYNPYYFSMIEGANRVLE
ncbi:MAG: LacI family DNA-binding transcriptional regulator, partial [Acutalibacter sp.]|nr:LacI family DNA-binding transcriptional regulator [Acutalibacter sp.]